MTTSATTNCDGTWRFAANPAPEYFQELNRCDGCGEHLAITLDHRGYTIPAIYQDRSRFAEYVANLRIAEYVASPAFAGPKPTEGVDVCFCGAKYWDGNNCASCGSAFRAEERGWVR